MANNNFQLNNLQRNPKEYWFLLKYFLNNKKYPCKFVTNFLEKTELFDSFFSKQCSPINNGSTLPTHMQYLNNHISFATFSQDDIAKKIQNIGSGKGHSHDIISIVVLLSTNR